jgi:hypothetical protein
MPNSELEKKWIEYSESKLKHYEKWYYHEINRDDRISKKIQFSTTLLIATGTFLLFLTVNFLNSSNKEYNYLDFLLFALLSLAWLLLLQYFVKIIKAYHGVSRAYLHLPDPHDSEKRERQLYQHYYKHYYSNPEKDITTRESALNSLVAKTKKERIDYFVNNTSNNFKLNNYRENQLFKSRIYFVICLILLIFCSVLLTSKAYVEETVSSTTSTETNTSKNSQDFTETKATEDEKVKNVKSGKSK